MHVHSTYVICCQALMALETVQVVNALCPSEPLATTGLGSNTAWQELVAWKHWTNQERNKTQTGRPVCRKQLCHKVCAWSLTLHVCST